MVNTHNKQRKKAKRKLDPKKIHQHFSLTVQDLSDIYDIDKSTVHSWIRDQGLVTIDNKSPAMVFWETGRQFIQYKNDALKMITGNAGDLPCMSCKMKKRAYLNQVKIEKISYKIWKAWGTCPVCGSSKMNMNISACDFQITITWGYQVVQELPVLSIKRHKDSNTTTTKKIPLSKNRFKPLTAPILNPENERIKHQYFQRSLILNNAKTILKLAKSLAIFDSFNNLKCYKKFNYKTAVEFQKYILKQYSHSLQTANRVMTHVRAFHIWLRDQNGYRNIKADDVQLLRLSLKDQAKARTQKPIRSLNFEEWENILLNIEPLNDIERRTQAILSCFLLTGIRIEALSSLKIGDVYLNDDFLFQDSNHVKTKFSKSSRADFYKLDPRIKKILADWMNYLIHDHAFRDNDPLFPVIHITLDKESLLFVQDGFINKHIESTTTIRKNIYEILKENNIYSITPHSIRHSIVRMVMGLDLTIEQLKAISQNKSHANLTTTISSYGTIPEEKKSQIIRDLNIEKLRKQKKLKEDPEYNYILSQIEDDTLRSRVFQFIAKQKK